MIGKYKIEITKRDVKFELVVDRQITVITGDSGIGKTYLVDAVSEYIESGRSSGIIVKSVVELDVGEATLAKAVRQLSENSKTIIFYDENNNYVLAEEFAKAVKHSDNYVVIVNREDIKNLPYSIKAVKSLTTSGTYGNFVTQLKELFNLYKMEKYFKPDLVVTEDKKSGFEFFSMISACKCKHADGNSNIVNALKNSKRYNNVLVIVDGAAFGALYRELKEYVDITSLQRIVVWSPESFEYLLLQSGLVEHKQLNDFLYATYDYADSCKYESWEQYYTWLLNELCQYNKIGNYSKDRLPVYFKKKQAIDEIAKNIPQELQL